MDKNEQLDEEFRLGLTSIRLYLRNINSEDTKLCQSWLNKLYNSVHERELRNRLLRDLIEHVKAGYLQHPFNEPPEQNPLSFIEVASKACGEGPYVSSWNSQPHNSPVFSSSENLTDKTINIDDFQSTDESAAVFPDRTKGKTRSEPFALARWRKTPDHQTANDGLPIGQYEGDDQALLNKVATLKAQNEALMHEISLYQLRAETTQKELYTLNQEVTTLRAKLSELQRLNTNIERKHFNAVSEQKRAVAENLLQITERLTSANNQNDELLNEVATLEIKISQLNRQNQDAERKLKSDICQLKSQLVKEKKRNQIELLAFQNLLRRKDEQLKKVDCHVKKQCNRMQEEVINIKNEMDHVANESNSQLRSKEDGLSGDQERLEY
nr:rho-associated protein kinase 1 isoform X3 [Halyomorpha halys]